LILGLPSTTSAADLSARLVRRLRRYYAPVRLLPGVPARCVLLAFRAGPAACLLLDTVEVSRFSRVQFLGVRKALSTTPGPAVACVGASAGLAFPWEVLGRHPGLSFRSSIPRPSMPFVCASPGPSRHPAQDSRSRWFATPFLWGSFIPDCTPVYPDACTSSTPRFSLLSPASQKRRKRHSCVVSKYLL
jgi:hypothetical protein